MRGHWLLGLTMASMAFLGCNGQPAGNAGAKPGTEADGGSGSIKHRTLESLPAVGAYLPPMDDGRVEVAPPEKWTPLARDNRYLVRFYKSKQTEPPRIEVSVTDTPNPDLTDATEENAAELVKQLKQYHQRLGRKFQEPPRPILLGDHLFVRNVRMARAGGELRTIVCLQTVHGGRLYTVELIVNPGPEAANYDEAIKTDQDAAYTVAAHLKFQGDATPATEPAEEKGDAKADATDEGKEKE